MQLGIHWPRPRARHAEKRTQYFGTLLAAQSGMTERETEQLKRLLLHRRRLRKEPDARLALVGCGLSLQVIHQRPEAEYRRTVFGLAGARLLPRGGGGHNRCHYALA